MTRIMFETDISNIWGSIEFSDLMKMEDRLSQAHNTLAQGTGEGNDFLGWYYLPSHTTEDELDEIQKAANRNILAATAVSMVEPDLETMLMEKSTFSSRAVRAFRARVDR